MAGSIEVEQLRERLGVARGTLVAGSLEATFAYFRDVLRVNPLDVKHLNYIRGIDFHRPVTVDLLTPGKLLVRFPEIARGTLQREQRKPYRFFALPGATPLHLGWNPDETGFELYRLGQPVHALVSYASAMRFRDTRSRLGGDRQVIVPWSTNVALLRQREFDRQKVAELFRSGYLPLGLP
jgi:hypothetical protein